MTGLSAPARLVSLCPSITETLAEVGLGGWLVGVTRYCTRPRQVVASLPKVGGTKTVEIRKIEDLAPDSIFANAEENRREDVEALSTMFPVHVSFPRSVAGIPAHIRELAEVAGAPGAGDLLAEEVESQRVRLEGGPARRFRYAYFIWKDPWMTVSGDTYVSDLLSYAGGENVFAHQESRYPEVRPETVLAAEPDVLFFSSEPFPFSEGHLPAIRGAFGESIPIELVDGDDCCWHGARTRQGLELMGRLRERYG
ncbi:MAG: helical backbone metal receptor [Thermoanaerobaculia bacterium]